MQPVRRGLKMGRVARLALVAVLLAPVLARAGSVPAGTVQASLAPAQEQCITTIGGFPAGNPGARYQLFRLTEALARDATPDFRAMLKQYGSTQVNTKTPILEVIKGIANPVLRQAEPSLVIGQISYLIDFAEACRTIISGQIDSLRAYDPDLAKPTFNNTIDQDALFLRQILSNALRRQKAHLHPRFGAVVQAYERALVRTRDQIEYQAFNHDVDELEALYMTDLDKRLARSNDLANKEMDREVLSGAVATAKDMTENNKKQEKQRSLVTLLHILGGF